jgi:hypothetical protein
MNLPLTGGCICGAVRYEITQAPASVYTCHCTDCQRVTVSAFSIGVVVPTGAFHLTGKEPQAAPGGVTAGGRPKIRWVCPDCGICIRRRAEVRHGAAGQPADRSGRDAGRYIMAAPDNALLDTE